MSVLSGQRRGIEAFTAINKDRNREKYYKWETHSEPDLERPFTPQTHAGLKKKVKIALEVRPSKTGTVSKPENGPHSIARRSTEGPKTKMNGESKNVSNEKSG